MIQLINFADSITNIIKKEKFDYVKSDIVNGSEANLEVIKLLDRIQEKINNEFRKFMS